MVQQCCRLLLFFQLGIIAIKQSASIGTVQFSALDCSNPVSQTTSLLRDVCENVEPTTKLGQQEVELLQVSNEQKVSGYKCTRVQSNFIQVCSMFSHMKLFQVPSIEVSVPVSADECSTMVKRGIMTRGDGTIEDIPINTWKHYSYLQHGRLEQTSNNVACYGTTIDIGGETVSSVLSMISEKVLVKQVEIESLNGRLKDLDTRTYLPTACYGEESCSVGTEAYVFNSPSSKCNLFKVRTVRMQMIRLDTEEGTKTALINDDHRLFFIMKNKENIPSDCVKDGRMYATQFPSVKVLLSVKKDSYHTVESVEIDINLEIQITTEYLQYQSKVELHKGLSNLGKRICSISQNKIKDMSLSPYHPDSIIHLQGDVINEIQCERVTVIAHVGEKRSNDCHLDSLPVYHDGKPAYMMSQTHILLDRSELTTTKCDHRRLPIFSNENGTIFLIAKPEISQINVQLSHIRGDLLHLFSEGNDEKYHFKSTLFYTQDEMKQFNELLHFGLTKTAVITSLIDTYCENGDCGGYHPSQSENRFDVDNLTSKLSPWGIARSIFEVIQPVGNVASIIILFVMSGNLLIKFYRLFSLRCLNRVSTRQAINIAMNPNGFITDMFLSNIHNRRNLTTTILDDTVGQDISLLRETQRTERPIRLTEIRELSHGRSQESVPYHLRR